MKNYSILLIFALGMSVTSYAQVQTQNLAADVDAELDRMYQSQTVQKAQQPSQPLVNQTIVVPQQVQQSSAQTTAQNTVQSQPTTVIEASPLTNSTAEAIRKVRQEEEMRTESKIVEKLERSRMEDEKRRAQILFGEKFNNLQDSTATSTTTTTTTTVAPTPVVVQPVTQPIVQPIVQPVVVEHTSPAQDSLSRDAVREEIRAALDSEKMLEEAKPYQTTYIAAMAGFGFYTGADNVKGKSVLGAAIGARFNEALMLEGAFIASDYEVDAYTYDINGFYMGYQAIDMKQYTGMFSGKYQLMSGVVRPVVGAFASYSYRDYKLAYSGTETGNSHALDVGLIGGVDFEINPRFSVGLDVKYMLWNAYNKVTEKFWGGYWGQIGEKLEKKSYVNAGLNVRLTF